MVELNVLDRPTFMVTLLGEIETLGGVCTVTVALLDFVR
jgi:hypothetical protein